MSDDTPTTPLDEIRAPEPSPAPAAASSTKAANPRRVPRSLLIGAASGFAVLLIGGLGAGAVAALNAHEPIESVPAAEAGVFQGGDSSGAPLSETPTPSPLPEPTSTPATVAPAGDPAALVAAIDRAVAAAGGTGASSIEDEDWGWSVDVILPDGTEVDVRVAADGKTTVRADHRDDSADRAIPPASIPDIAAAAIAAVGSGTVTSIESEDDGGYDVTVRSGGTEFEVELYADLSVREVGDD